MIAPTPTLVASGTSIVVGGVGLIRKKGNKKDVFSITVLDPVTNAIAFEATAELDGGNVQIHPPVGNSK